MTLLKILWGSDSEISNLYELDLFVVFVLSFLVEWLSHTRFINSDTTSTVIAGLLQTGLYGIRITLAYLVMLSVMSLDIGVFLVAIAGYTAGFLVFGSRVFDKSETASSYRKPSDLPPLNC